MVARISSSAAKQIRDLKIELLWRKLILRDASDWSQILLLWQNQTHIRFKIQLRKLEHEKDQLKIKISEIKEDIRLLQNTTIDLLDRCWQKAEQEEEYNLENHKPNYISSRTKKILPGFTLVVLLEDLEYSYRGGKEAFLTKYAPEYNNDFAMLAVKSLEDLDEVLVDITSLGLSYNSNYVILEPIPFEKIGKKISHTISEQYFLISWLRVYCYHEDTFIESREEQQDLLEHS